MYNQCGHSYGVTPYTLEIYYFKIWQFYSIKVYSIQNSIAKYNRWLLALIVSLTFPSLDTKLCFTTIYGSKQAFIGMRKILFTKWCQKWWGWVINLWQSCYIKATLSDWIIIYKTNHWRLGGCSGFGMSAAPKPTCRFTCSYPSQSGNQLSSYWLESAVAQYRLTPNLSPVDWYLVGELGNGICLLSPRFQKKFLHHVCTTVVVKRDSFTYFQYLWKQSDPQELSFI